MTARVNVLKSNLNSIYANLAIEEALIAADVSRPTLFLWRNRPTVTVGRHQNPWKECNLKLMEESGVTLARRYSGGGAVYQDLGCSTFTFIHSLNPLTAPSAVIDSNFDLLTEALGSLGLSASRKGRNDIVVGDLKVSGSAFKQVSDRMIHHGTILVNTDMSQLSKYLTPSKLKLQAKGISSVSARVSNLSDIKPSVDHDLVCDALSSQFRKYYSCPSHDEPVIVDDIIQSDEIFRQHHKTLLDWDWRYGSTPEFSHLVETRIDGIGIFDVHYQVNQGRISDIKIFSDCLVPDLVDNIQHALIGCEYRPSAIRTSLYSIQATDDVNRRILSEFTEWLIHEIE